MGVGLQEFNLRSIVLLYIAFLSLRLVKCQNLGITSKDLKILRDWREKRGRKDSLFWTLTNTEIYKNAYIGFLFTDLKLQYMHSYVSNTLLDVQEVQMQVSNEHSGKSGQ